MSNTAERKPPAIELRAALPERVYVRVELAEAPRKPAASELRETRRGAVRKAGGTREWVKFQGRLFA